MRIVFEDHQYEASVIQEELKEISSLQDVEKKISVSYVGYFYNARVNDCVFILPKVLLEDKTIEQEDGSKKTIEILANVSPKTTEEGKDYITPEDIITPEGQQRYLPDHYREFVYKFSVWVYRALAVYRKQNPSSKAIYYKQLPQEGRGRRHKADTYLDIVLSMIRFNKENQNFFVFTIKNIHSGINKINWTKTISKSPAIIQGNEVVYSELVNKKRQVNFDDELFIIFFSILNYLSDTYGFTIPINCQYELIKGKQFESLMHGRGQVRLKQIKYKYFSDKTLQMWDLCYAFFDEAYKIAVNTDQKEYLLAKNFEIVFEAMIDELIGDKNIPQGLKEQYDGKRVDHMYTYDSLTTSDDKNDDIYYIGDSKYYKVGHQLGRQSIYKQFTYARNVIQWNIDLFLDDPKTEWTPEEKQQRKDDKEKFGQIKLRNDVEDPLTEGYNVIPNFFISAFVDENRQYVAQENIKLHDGKQSHLSYQFKDRLFDRDTLILSHYDVNFLYILYLYARNKQGEKAVWRDKVREKFRSEIRNVLNKNYDFYALMAKGNPLDGEQIIKDNFKELQGKLYRPYGDKNLYALALERKEGGDTKNSEAYNLLSEFFEISPVTLGQNPKEKLEQQVVRFQLAHPYQTIPQEWLPEYHLERYGDSNIVVGLYHDQAHWDWITGKNDKDTLIYNVRVGDRKGGRTKSNLRAMKVRFAILYEEGHEQENRYHVFRIHDTAFMTEERMKRAMYPNPQGDYFIFRFDEEVSINPIDLPALLNSYKEKPDYIEGAPIYITSKELLEKFGK